MISSTGNAKIRNLVQLKRSAKARKKAGFFTAEGYRLFREIPKEQIREVYVSVSFWQEHKSELECLKEAEKGRCFFETVSDEVFSYVSDTQTPQGILSVVQMLPRPDDSFFSGNGVWLILENLQDPGNLGTLFRTGEGAGIAGVIMDSRCADVYAPKVIRSTMGSIFRVPFLITSDLPGEIRHLQKSGVKVYAAAGGADVCYDEPDYRQACAFMIGNEGNGLSKELIGLADQGIFIPMSGKLESLNASVAGSVLMYEAGRQRRRI